MRSALLMIVGSTVSHRRHHPFGGLPMAEMFCRTSHSFAICSASYTSEKAERCRYRSECATPNRYRSTFPGFLHLCSRAVLARAIYSRAASAVLRSHPQFISNQIGNLVMFILWWILVGLIAGFITGKLMKGSGFGASWTSSSESWEP